MTENLNKMYTAYIKRTQPNGRLCQFYVGRVHFLRVSCETQFHNFIVLF